MARKRPTASDALPLRPSLRATSPAGAALLTRAEDRALRRSAPLTPAEFKALGRLVERGTVPVGVVVSAVVRGGAERRRRSA